MTRQFAFKAAHEAGVQGAHGLQGVHGVQGAHGVKGVHVGGVRRTLGRVRQLVMEG